MSRKIFGVTVGTSINPQAAIAKTEQAKQIKQNTKDISEKADAIIANASGEIIKTTDSTNAPLQGMKVYGKFLQNTVSGNQLFNANKFTNTTKDGVEITNNGDGSITIGGSGELISYFSVTHSYSHAETMKLLKAGTITLSSGGAITNPYINVILFYNNRGKQLNINLDGKTQATATIKEEYLDDSCFLMLGFNGSSGSTIQGGTVKPMMYQNGSGTFEQYTGGIASPNIEYPQDIHSRGENGSIVYGLYGGNLIPFMTEGFASTKNGLTLTVYKDKCVVSGTPSGTYSQAIRELISLPKGTYRLKGGEVKSGCAYLQIRIEKEGQVAQNYFADATFTIDGTETAVYVSIQAGNYTTALNDYVLYPTLNVGTEALSFELYKEPQSLVLQTPNGLNGLPVSSGGNYTDANGQQWLCDEIDLKRGKRVQRIMEVVFDGSSDEKWVIDAVGRYRTNIVDVSNKKIITPANINDVGNAMCTHANIYSSGSTYQHTGIGMSLDTNGRIQFYLGEAEQNLDTWNTRLAESPVTCYFVLQTPIETDLTEEEIAQYKALRMNYPNTTLLNDTGAYTEIEYVADTKNYISNMQEQHEADMTALKTAIVALGGTV